MEDDTRPTNNQTAPASSGGVMDVKAPQPQAAGVPPLPGSRAEEPLTSAPLPDETPAPEDTIAPPESEHIMPSPPDHAEHLLAAHANPKNHPPLAAIVIAVIIAVALVGVTIFAYLSTRDATHQQDDDHTAQQESTEQAAVTTTDVDDATQDVDSTLSSVDDAKDFPESDLTDQALGL